MDATTLVVIAVLVVAAIGGYIVWQRQRSKTLQNKFGDEYSRAVDEVGSRRQAEAELEARARRVKALDIRPLNPNDRLRFIDAWRGVQAEFVDSPAAAISKADRLLAEVMVARGYPVDDFDQRLADLSVEHGDVVEHYRTAHAIALDHERGKAGTEDLRRAMIHYRELFEELVGEPPGRRGDSTHQPESSHVRH
jgi:hypothetical protein